MYIFKQMPEFAGWLDGIKDAATRMRLDQAQRGLLGDIKPVGEGVFEMREFFGPGWRMYYVLQNGMLIVMLGGGEKSSQPSDIDSAIALSKTLLKESEDDPKN